MIGSTQDIIRVAVPACLSTLLAAGCVPAPERVLHETQNATLTVDLQIGSLLGEGPQSFGRIGGLLGDPNGRILVADQLSSEVRVFDDQGVHQFSFGGEGSGPEEFSGPCCLGWGPDGRVWVRDGGNHRYSSFELGPSGAELVAGHEMVHSDVNFMAPLTFSAAGNLIDVGHRTSETGGAQLVRFEVSATGEILDSTVVWGPSPEEIGQFEVTRETAEGQVRFFFYQPFGPSHLVAHGPEGRWAGGIGSSYSLEVHSPDGEYGLQGEAQGPALSSRERGLAEQSMEAYARRAGRNRNTMPFEIPDQKPPLQAVFFDSSGRLWVERSTPDGEPRSADVWAPDGTLESRVEWPRNITLAPPAWVGEGWGLGILRDSLDVEYVVRVRF